MAITDKIIGTELGPEFSIGGIQPNKVMIKLGPNMIRNLDGSIDISITTNSVIKLVGYAGGHILEDGTSSYEFNSSVTRTAVGRYTVEFDDPHPNGTNYNLSVSVQSDEPNRDQRKISWLNKTATGFDVVITVDDNGGNADVYVDEQFQYTAFQEQNFIVSIT